LSAEATGEGGWSPEAITDLESIWDFYVDAAGRHTAAKMVREIAETCRSIATDLPVGLLATMPVESPAQK
jgi:plasmid stabilization system protein ParE